VFDTQAVVDARPPHYPDILHSRAMAMADAFASDGMMTGNCRHLSGRL
jgi:hypothetical protein